jgi:succinate-semialdehyde dehydrogenase/glutarate-semialdehyde dehydrogenase
VLTEVADASADDALAALDAAAAIQEEWAAHPPRERGEILRRAYEDLMRPAGRARASDDARDG